MIINKIDDIFLGKRLGVYLDGKGFISQSKTESSIFLDVIAITNKITTSSRFIFGSKTQITPMMHPRTGMLGSDLIYVHNQDEYKFSQGVNPPFEVMDGPTADNCRKCRYENMSGQSNQPDGSYVCLQCSIFCHILGTTP